MVISYEGRRLMKPLTTFSIVDSRLTGERCHGHGYVRTTLCRLPCLACSAPEHGADRQESPEAVSAHQ
jgi:hypothetical protein